MYVTCDKCIYWKPDHERADFRECRRHAPMKGFPSDEVQYLRNGQPRPSNRAPSFPITSADCGCGEGEPKLATGADTALT